MTRWLVCLALVISANGYGQQPDPERRPTAAWSETVEPFLREHCFACHDERQSLAGFRIDQLSNDFSVPGVADHWLEVMDQLNLGNMPPEDEPRPDSDRIFAVAKWIAGELEDARRRARAGDGQSPMRRLNRDEYANTIRDLLLIDRQHLHAIIEELPGDGRAEGFDRLGAGLFFDQTQIDRMLQAAKTIAELAIVDPSQGPSVRNTRFEAENPKADGMGIREPERKTRNRFVVTKPQHRVDTGPLGYDYDRQGVTFVQGNEVYRQGFTMGRVSRTKIDDLVTEDGYYRIRIRCGADRGTRDEPIRLMLGYHFGTPLEQTVMLDVAGSLDEPQVVETEMFLRRGSDDQRRSLTLVYNDLPRYIQSSDEAAEFNRSIRGTISDLREANLAGRDAEAELLSARLAELRAKAKAWQGPARQINPDFRDVRPPRLYVDWMELEGPLQEHWPPLSHQRIFFDGDDRQGLDYVREMVQRFLPLAFRRPVSETEVDRVVQFIEPELAATGDIYAAMRLGLQRILTSPGFLFLQSNRDTDHPQQLSPHELASRLSYFLWSSMPDHELLDLADQDKLRDPKVLHQQVDRMLADTKSRALVENFVGQWLSVREFGSVMPATQYREYDDELEAASKQEAYEFFAEILRSDLPITTLLDSDFVMVNERLATHYGIEGVTGEAFRKVTIRPEHHRGGVLGMAGLMTLLSDGTRTLPVRRAAWIVTQFFNDPPPPPPPNAGEVQPNTAGEKLTVRQRLERHRDDPTCASCHRTLDPYGLALENYDAIGMWREVQNGEGFRGRNLPPLDVSGTLPSGRRFETLQQFKDSLLAEKDRFAEAFTQRLLTYAWCRPVGFADVETTARLTASLASNDYRIQSVIHAIVADPTFQRK
tara:strand:- start:153876 stop:156506 length:2631 start_codon:yes stop_codon:yes gene_type:complete